MANKSHLRIQDYNITSTVLCKICKCKYTSVHNKNKCLHNKKKPTWLDTEWNYPPTYLHCKLQQSQTDHIVKNIWFNIGSWIMWRRKKLKFISLQNFIFQFKWKFFNKVGKVSDKILHFHFREMLTAVLHNCTNTTKHSCTNTSNCNCTNTIKHNCTNTSNYNCTNTTRKRQYSVAWFLAITRVQSRRPSLIQNYLYQGYNTKM